MRGRCWIVIGCVWIAAWTCATRAQYSSDGVHLLEFGGFQVWRTDPGIVGDVVGLDAAQLDALRALYQARRGKESAAIKSLQQAERALFEKNGSRLDKAFYAEREKLHAQFEQFRERNAAALFDEIKAVLTGEQMARWPRAEARLRRMSILSQSADGRRGVINVDLLEIGRGLPSECAPVLEEFERRAAPLLDEYETWRADQKKVMCETRGKPRAEIQAALDDSAARLKPIQERIERLNLDTAAKLISTIDDPLERARFEVKWFDHVIETWTQLSGSCSREMTKLLAAARGYAGLSAEERRAVDETADEFVFDAAKFDRHTFDAVRAIQMTTPEKFGLDESLPADWLRRRREFTERWCGRLREVMRPETLDAMPFPLRPAEKTELEFEE